MLPLRQDEMEKVLEKIFEHLEEKGIKFNAEKKQEIKEQIASDLKDTLTNDDVKDPNLQKKLIGCITSLATGKKQDYQAMIGAIKSEDERLQPMEKLDLKLTAEIMLLTMLSKALNPELQKTNAMKPDIFKQKLSKEAEENKNQQASFANEKNILEELLDNCLRNLYGGDNPTLSGEINFPVLYEVGNVAGNPNILAQSGFMKDQVTFNPEKMDPLGLENSTLIKELAQNEMDLYISPTPKFSPPH